MKILRTYLRVWVDDLDEAVATYTELLHQDVDLYIDFNGSRLAAIGEVLLISGPAEVTDQFRGTAGPILVEDIQEALDEVRSVGGTLTSELFEGPTGTLFYADLPGGGNLEFLQWTQDLVDRIIGPAAPATVPS